MHKKHWIILLLAGNASLLGCLNSSGCTEERCHTAVITASSDADVLLPPATMQAVGAAVNELLFLRLADIGPALNTVGDEEFVPRLASSWTFNDPLAITFTMDENARWHDGKPITAYDVEFTYDIYRDTVISAAAGAHIQSITAVTARDERTVEFHFTHKYPEQFFDATYHMKVLPKHVLDTIPPSQLRTHHLAQNPVGSGPYKLSEWRRGEFIRLVANTAFFLGEPEVREIIWRVTPDQAASVSQLIAGEADVIDNVVDPDQLSRIQNADHLRLIEYPAPAYGYIGFNFDDPDVAGQPHPLFRDPDLRRAIAKAIDKETAVQAVFGDQGAVPIGATSRAVWIWSDQISQIGFDAHQAGVLLAQAGWTDEDGDGIRERDGQPLEFELLVPASSGVRRRTATIVQEQLRRVGIAMNIAEVEFGAFIQRATTGQFDAVFGAWVLDPSPRGMRELWTSAGVGGSNWGSYQNTEIDQLVETALEALTADQATRHWHAVLTALNNDVPAIWLFEPLLTAVVERRFANASIRPDLWAANIWQWNVN